MSSVALLQVGWVPRWEWGGTGEVVPNYLDEMPVQPDMFAAMLQTLSLPYAQSSGEGQPLLGIPGEGAGVLPSGGCLWRGAVGKGSQSSLYKSTSESSYIHEERSRKDCPDPVCSVGCGATSEHSFSPKARVLQPDGALKGRLLLPSLLHPGRNKNLSFLKLSRVDKHHSTPGYLFTVTALEC